VKTRESFFSMMTYHAEQRWITTTLPAFEEEYFEWIDVLEAVQQAQGQFTLIELGAGWGRWLVRAAAAVKATSKVPFKLLGVEAEPKHFEWMKQHFRDNGIDPNAHELIEAAVSDKDGEVWFYVGLADGWYGQAIAPGPSEEEKAGQSTSAARNPRAGLLDGVRGLVPTALKPRPQPVTARAPELDQLVSGLSKGEHTEAFMQKARAVSLTSLLQRFERVDLIDLDVQGAELDVLRAAATELDRKVRRVHVGTHSLENEVGLREVFRGLGWISRNDYSLQATHPTPYGEISFGDGVQTWINAKI
jgi:methyltransferase FkbM-like protein